jgi:hypothetical protein
VQEAKQWDDPAWVNYLGVENEALNLFSDHHREIHNLTHPMPSPQQKAKQLRGQESDLTQASAARVPNKVAPNVKPGQYRASSLTYADAGFAPNSRGLQEEKKTDFAMSADPHADNIVEDDMYADLEDMLNKEDISGMGGSANRGPSYGKKSSKIGGFDELDFEGGQDETKFEGGDSDDWGDFDSPKNSPPQI